MDEKKENSGQDKRKKRAILVGIGAHAHSWKKALEAHDDWELAAVVDTDTEKLEHAALWGVDEDEAFTNITEAVEFGEGNYDLAIIATPIYTHHVLVLEAMDLGLNVICEKNLCSTVEQGRMLVKATYKYPHLCTATGTQTRYFPKNWTVKKYIMEHREELGQLCSIHAVSLSNWGRQRRGWRAWLPDIFLEDMAPHHFDYIRYLSEMDVVQVQGVNTIPKFSTFRGSSTTYAILALAKKEDYDNPDNWIYVTYRGDWQKRGDTYVSFEVNFENADIFLKEHNKSKKVYVDKFTNKDGSEFERIDVPLDSNVEYNERGLTDQLLILEQMSKGIDSHGKIQPATNFRDAFKTFAVVMGIKESFQTGKAVYLPKYWKNLYK